MDGKMAVRAKAKYHVYPELVGYERGGVWRGKYHTYHDTFPDVIVKPPRHQLHWVGMIGATPLPPSEIGLLEPLDAANDMPRDMCVTVAIPSTAALLAPVSQRNHPPALYCSLHRRS
ncbi:hypothetical protein C8J57DRAFT_1516873 [Mycena rebaudengoi]|nr:hypothetical protein C8J57DRAFT_1516873 [Mycena rebaudengoi]